MIDKLNNIFIFAALLSLCIGCSKTEKITESTINDIGIGNHDVIEKANTIENAENDEYLYVGGVRQEYKLSELDSVTIDHIRITAMMNNLEGIEQLKNLHRLSISSDIPIGQIDLSSLNSLSKLEGLHFSYTSFYTIPDFSRIPSLKDLSLRDCTIR